MSAGATLTDDIAGAVAEGRMSGRVWLYANYHCNLACSYCLTESAPKVDPRMLRPGMVRRVAVEARDLGFTGLGITGGEPFLLRWLPDLLAEIAEILPVLCLSNGTLFTDKLVERMRPLADLPVAIQISLDRPDPIANDEMRGPRNFAKVMDAIPRLLAAGIKVRIATTLERDEIREVKTAEQERLCALHRGFGISDEDHVIRPIVARGRALTEGLGVAATRDDLEPELTITADGAFWNPFAPTVRDGHLDTDLMLTRTTAPLSMPAATMLQLAQSRPAGADARLGIR
jgi:MoaA/NifB/PqqE/SkfB family radical SAM enzyme